MNIFAHIFLQKLYERALEKDEKQKRLKDLRNRESIGFSDVCMME